MLLAIRFTTRWAYSNQYQEYWLGYSFRRWPQKQFLCFISLCHLRHLKNFLSSGDSPYANLLSISYQNCYKLTSTFCLLEQDHVPKCMTTIFAYGWIIILIRYATWTIHSHSFQLWNRVHFLVVITVSNKFNKIILLH